MILERLRGARCGRPTSLASKFLNYSCATGGASGTPPIFVGRRRSAAPSCSCPLFTVWGPCLIRVYKSLHGAVNVISRLAEGMSWHHRSVTPPVTGACRARRLTCGDLLAFAGLALTCSLPPCSTAPPAGHKRGLHVVAFPCPAATPGLCTVSHVSCRLSEFPEWI